MGSFGNFHMLQACGSMGSPTTAETQRAQIGRKGDMTLCEVSEVVSGSFVHPRKEHARRALFFGELRTAQSDDSYQNHSTGMLNHEGQEEHEDRDQC